MGPTMCITLVSHSPCNMVPSFLSPPVGSVSSLGLHSADLSHTGPEVWGFLLAQQLLLASENDKMHEWLKYHQLWNIYKVNVKITNYHLYQTRLIKVFFFHKSISPCLLFYFFPLSRKILKKIALKLMSPNVKCSLNFHFLMRVAVWSQPYTTLIVITPSQQ